MKILDRLPVADEHILLNVPGGRLRTKPYQIIISVSISDGPTWDARSPIIPALLDTGNNHNFSIQEHHLRRWTGIHSEALPFLRVMREGGRTPSLRFANVWIHRNQGGRRELRAEEPVLLPLHEGIAIYPDDGRKHVSLRSVMW